MAAAHKDLALPFSLDPPVECPRAAFPVAGLHGLFPGMFFLPLACSAACPGSPGPGSGVGLPWRASGCGPGRGWSGRGRGRPAGGFPQVQPLLLAVPALGQVHGEVAAAVPGGAAGDRDQGAADGRGPGLREDQAGQGAGRAPPPGPPARRAAPGPPPAAGRRATPGSGHRTMRASSRGYAAIALTGCPLEPGAGSVRYSHYPSSEGTLHVDTPGRPLIDRWIEVQSGR
jgi:hypothetical protein